MATVNATWPTRSCEHRSWSWCSWPSDSGAGHSVDGGSDNNENHLAHLPNVVNHGRIGGEGENCALTRGTFNMLKSQAA
jgi:hypothetical protein